MLDNEKAIFSLRVISAADTLDYGTDPSSGWTSRPDKLLKSISNKLLCYFCLKEEQMLRSLDFLSLGGSHAIFVRVDVYLQAFISSLCISSIIRQRLLRLCVMLCLFVAPCACLFVWLIESSRAAAVRRAYSVRLIEAGRCSLLDVSRYLAATDRYCILFLALSSFSAHFLWCC